MTSVLFVCLGNICRSPAAEGMFTKLAKDKGWLSGVNDIVIDSVGTGGWHVGKAPDQRMQDAMSTRGFDISHLRGREFSHSDFDRFEHIIAMDVSNQANIERMAPPTHKGRARLLLSYVEGLSQTDVPDPYYGGADGFEQCLDLIEAGVAGVVKDIEKS